MNKLFLFYLHIKLKYLNKKIFQIKKLIKYLSIMKLIKQMFIPLIILQTNIILMNCFNSEGKLKMPSLGFLKDQKLSSF